ncbi:LOW QUALITY PROTEIN: ciliary microtubule-associated protein 2 [Ciconia maguari]
MEGWDAEQQIPTSISTNHPLHPAVEPWLAEHGLSLVPQSRHCRRQRSGSALQGKTSASGWTRAEKGSWLSQLPRFQFKEITKRCKHQQERLGPGMYNIRDFLQETWPSSLQGICDTREQRFGDAHRDCFPGPGTYGPGEPSVCLEERDKRSASTRGLMGSRTAAAWDPGPNSIDKGLWWAGGPGPCQPFLGDSSKPADGGHHALDRRGTEPSTGTVKGFLDELRVKEDKKKGCFSTLTRNPGCPMERIFWATLSQGPREAHAVGLGSYNPKPIETSTYSSQPPFWSSAKRFNRKSYCLFTGNENPVDVGRYNTTEHEKYPQKMRYQSRYWCNTQWYLNNLKWDAYLL